MTTRPLPPGDPTEADAWRAADLAHDALLQQESTDLEAALEAMSLPPGVRDKVRILLRAQAGAVPLLDRFAGQAPGDLVGRSIGHWHIERELGRGGMAVVYEATREGPPRRRVALKLMTLGSLAANGAQRFAQEQQILAQLSHPNIAPLFEAGVAADGTPWLAMALIEGQRIDHWCDAHGLDARARVRLVRQVCGAVAHAHSRLIVHRDIKPSNVLVDREGHVFLLDFGIARLLDEAGEATTSQLLALSPLHAAPEQFRGTPPSTAMDVYGLGALLFQVLTGAASRQVGTAPDAAPHPPSRVAGRGDADLDAIVLRALAPDPAERYGSVDALAADLDRWVAGRPVQAQSQRGAAYRLRKFVVRNRVAVAGAALLLLSVIAGAVATAWQAQRARDEAQRAVAERERAERSLARTTALRDFLLGLFLANYPDRPRGELPTTAELLTEGARQARSGSITDPLVRSEMLVALGRIYFIRGLLGEAAPLFDQAEKDLPSDAPIDVRVGLLRALGDLDEARGDIGAAVRRYDAAIALYPQPDSPERLIIEGKRAFLEIQRNDPVAASARLEPLLERMRAAGLDPREQRRVLGALVVSLARGGRYAEAQQRETELIELTRELHGEHSLAMGIVHGNAVGLSVRLGDFVGAERHAREAIAIYDRIFDAPSNFRSGAWTALGDTHRHMGRWDEALDAYAKGFDELARFLGQGDPTELPEYLLSRGRVFSNAGRCGDALPELTGAIARTVEREGINPATQQEARALLARCRCVLGDARSAARLLAEIDEVAAKPGPDLQLVIEDARAECALTQGQRALAIEIWTRARTQREAWAPGEAGTFTLVALREAEVRADGGDLTVAASLRSEVKHRLDQVALQQHPRYGEASQAVEGR